MKVIVNGRQSGKTHTLVEWIKEGEETDSYPGWSRILLCHSLEEAQRIRQLYDLDYRQVFAVSEWKTARMGRKPVDIAVDNVDLILTSYLGQHPAQIAMTGTTE